MSKKEKPPKIRPLNEDALKGTFVDGWGIGTGEGIVNIVFVTSHGEAGYIFSRIVLTVEMAKHFAETINEAVKKISEEKK